MRGRPATELQARAYPMAAFSRLMSDDSIALIHPPERKTAHSFSHSHRAQDQSISIRSQVGSQPPVIVCRGHALARTRRRNRIIKIRQADGQLSRHRHAAGVGDRAAQTPLPANRQLHWSPPRALHPAAAAGCRDQTTGTHSTATPLLNPSNTTQPTKNQHALTDQPTTTRKAKIASSSRPLARSGEIQPGSR